MKNNNKNPDFSIIIPTYNRADLVRQSIISALRQKQVSIEVIVIDDSSADDTEKLVKALKDRRVRYFKNKTRVGYALNVKKCFNRAQGNYIFTLGDDDLILDEYTLFEVLRIMKKYKVGIGKIKSILFNKNPKLPSRMHTTNNKLVVIKPKKGNNTTKLFDKETILKLFGFEINFYSGIIFDMSIVDKKKNINHILYPYFPLLFDAVLKSGMVFIPNYFIVGYISYQMVPIYFSLDKQGSFVIDDLFAILKKFMDNKSFESFKKGFIQESSIHFPSIKYFTDNQNYIRVLKKTLELDKTLLINYKFIILALLGFMPKFIIKILRDCITYLSEKKTVNLVKKYNYFQKLEKLGVQ